MKKLTLLAADLVTFFAALSATLLLRYGPGEFAGQYDLHALPFAGLFVIWTLSFYIANLYERRVLRNDTEFFGRLAQAGVLAGLLSVAFFYLIPLSIAPRTNLFLFIIIETLFIAGVRALANRTLAGGAKKRLLVVGATEEAVALARLIVDNPQLGWAVRAVVRLGQENLAAHAEGPWQLLDDQTELASFIREHHIDAVVISLQAYGRDELIAALYGAMGERVDFYSLVSFSETLTGRVPLDAIGQQWFLDNIAENSKKPYELAKRVMDIAVGVLLGIPALILLPFIACAVKLSSPGPIFFRQSRTGRGGTPFPIIKFRTMRADAEADTGAVWATTNDPRTTYVGNFLRRTRLDELPQLWNILRGEMSLVGPRAERPEFDVKLATQIPFYRERYLIKPGLSGWAQINYSYGSSAQDALRKLEYDLYYIKRRSLALDVAILLKTASIALRREGR